MSETNLTVCSRCECCAVDLVDYNTASFCSACYFKKPCGVYWCGGNYEGENNDYVVPPDVKN